MSEYVIKTWNVKENADGGPNVIVEGRAAGLLNWILGILKIKGTVTFIVTAEKALYTSASAAGYITHITPLKNICSTFYGYKKPWKAAVVVGAFAIFILSFLLPAILCVPVEKSYENRDMLRALAKAGMSIAWPLGILIGLVYYRLSQALTLGFIEFSGKEFKVAFKPSVIEGVGINYEKAAEACNIIQTLVDAKR